MRVIAGKFRSRPLRSLRGMDVRPTSDRLRETLFNVLTAGNPRALEGSVWIDLFAGTGAVGIEALSRGAEKVYFVERSKRAVELIRSNLEGLKIAPGAYEILALDALAAIHALDSREAKPGYIFLDPPYAMKAAYSRSLQDLAQSRLAEEAWIIVEHEKKFDPGESFDGLQRRRKLQQGDAALSLYQKAVP